RDAELLSHPVHEGDIDGGLARPFSLDAVEHFGHDLVELHRIGREQEVAHGIGGLFRALRILVVAHDGRAFSVPGDAVADIGGMQRLAVGAGRHRGGPRVHGVQADDLGFERGSGGRSGQRARGDRRNSGSFHKTPSVHFTLLVATSSRVQYSSLRSSMRTMGVRWVVALMNLPSPRYMPVWVMRLGELPKYSRSPGSRFLRSTGSTPL